MTEEVNNLNEIVRLREQMHSTYIRDNFVSEAVLKVSTALDKHIYACITAADDAEASQ